MKLIIGALLAFFSIFLGSLLLPRSEIAYLSDPILPNVVGFPGLTANWSNKIFNFFFFQSFFNNIIPSFGNST